MPQKHVYIYTDGSCDVKSKEGGWGYLLIFKTPEGKVKKQCSAYEADTTNNRMELTAAVRALEALKESCQVTLTTDSKYLKNAFTEKWLETWQHNGWRTANKKPVKNQDLWQILIKLSHVHVINWEWTEGHAGHPENELVDSLALNARKNKQGEEKYLRS